MSLAAPVEVTPLDRSQPWLECNGQQLTWILHGSLTWLENNHEAINALNVFPVPDGDSGTNMLLTMQSAVEETSKTPTHSAGDVLQAVAKGALMGARGNSGVILSQFFRGMANTLAGKQTMRAQDLAAALQAGARLAYQGVQKPVEGTILTVAR